MRSEPTGGPAGGSRRTTLQEREDAVVARLRTLAAGLDDAPDPAFRTATRARLVAMAAVRTPEPAARPRLRRPAGGAGPVPAWRARLTAGLAGVATAVAALGALAALAGGAGPGEALYGVKRGTEATRLALAGDDRGLALLELAGARLDELAALPDDGPASLAADVLATMDAQTTEGAARLAARAVEDGAAAPVDTLSGWAAAQHDELAALRPELPPAAADDAADSLGLLDAVAERAAAVRVALGCPGGPSVAGTDDLGPVPAPCRAGAAAPPEGSADGGAAGEVPAPGPGEVPAPGPGPAPLPAPGPGPAAGVPGGGAGPTPPGRAGGTVPGPPVDVPVPAPAVPGPFPSGPQPRVPAPLPPLLDGAQPAPGPVPPVLDGALPGCLPPPGC